jgi:serine protease Do
MTTGRKITGCNATLVLWLVVGLACLVPAAKAQTLAPTQTTVDRARVVALSGSVLRIEVQREQGGFAMGSGVVLTADRIATNCHVTRDAVAIHVLRGGARWRVQSQVSNPELDLCVLRVPALQGTPVTVVKAGTVKAGQPLAALGYIGGVDKPQVSFGEVVEAYAHAGADVIQSSTSFTSGASGGGLFDADGSLVGILTFRLRGGEAHYFAAPAAWLEPLLGATQHDQAVAPLRPAAPAFWEQPAALQPRFLQALALEQRMAWPDLLALAGAWRSADPSDPHARRWYRLAQTRMCQVQNKAVPCA